VGKNSHWVGLICLHTIFVLCMFGSVVLALYICLNLNNNVCQRIMTLMSITARQVTRIS